jgi:hypothetical protein
MVIKRDKWGNKWREGRQTPEEEREFYRRTAGGPVTVVKRSPALHTPTTAPNDDDNDTPKEQP